MCDVEEQMIQRSKQEFVLPFPSKNHVKDYYIPLQKISAFKGVCEETGFIKQGRHKTVHKTTLFCIKGNGSCDL